MGPFTASYEDFNNKRTLNHSPWLTAQILSHNYNRPYQTTIHHSLRENQKAEKAKDAP